MPPAAHSRGGIFCEHTVPSEKRKWANGPGIAVNTSPTDFAPISQLQLMRFKGEKWELFGDVISGDVGG